MLHSETNQMAFHTQHEQYAYLKKNMPSVPFELVHMQALQEYKENN